MIALTGVHVRPESGSPGASAETSKRAIQIFDYLAMGYLIIDFPWHIFELKAAGRVSPASSVRSSIVETVRARSEGSRVLEIEVVELGAVDSEEVSLGSNNTTNGGRLNLIFTVV